MFGAEMGCNEFGVCIGNEAVFTKIPFDKKNTGLTGMDLLRLSLEISKTAKEGLENIIYYLEKYGQDACGGYTDKSFYYHNSFIIADRNEGFVLETAGKHWIYEKVTGYRAISNGLSIEEKYDGISKEAIEFARKKGWSKKNKNFSFKKAYSQWLMPKLAACEYRRNNSEEKGKSFSDFSIENAFQVLRSHGENPTSFLPENGSTKNICMHASGLFTPHQSVGSMVVELRKEKPTTVWLTGTSAPCLSFFKPFYFGNDILKEENFIVPIATFDNSYWWQWEKLHRAVLKNYTDAIPFIQFKQQELEQLWIKQDKILTEENWNLINAKQFH
jgi:dipeptidase